MNNLLNVKVRFNNEKRKPSPFYTNLTANNQVSVDHIDKLCKDLKSILSYYNARDKLLNNVIIDVNYNDVIAKYKRIGQLLKGASKNLDSLIIGARFSDNQKHIITYYVEYGNIYKAISDLEEIRKFLLMRLNGLAQKNNFNKPNAKIDYTGFSLKEEELRQLIVDCSVVESLSIPNVIAKNSPEKEKYLLTFFKTEKSITEILSRIGLDGRQRTEHDQYTISVDKELYNDISNSIPYMISMISKDLSIITPKEAGITSIVPSPNIPKPTNEPTIGVIDSLCANGIYFSEWVENIDFLDEIEKIATTNADRIHGTEVTSIVVDGPELNPGLDDNCGRFRVRHFGVCDKQISMTRLQKKIRNIVLSNLDIHVWNLSLGTIEEISENFISLMAETLDELAANNNIIFVVAGTNDLEKTHFLKIGAPADSINSIVVNSIKRNGISSSYSRHGGVLSFFNKPDIAYYGGDESEPLKVYSPSGYRFEFGTSYAAPWISRKMCYLIDVLGLPREIAKALIIDSAAGWEYKKNNYKLKDWIGYGAPPIEIDRIISSPKDEIKFYLYGTSKTYITTNYRIPIPKDENSKYPYIARATLCYFPECSRNQGIDYTNRELSLKFGRVNTAGQIIDINDNTQDSNGSFSTERKARDEFRKWENTKFISKIEKKNRPLMSYEDRQWGFSIVSKERLTTNTKRKDLNFGVVITLKDISGKNRIQDFIRMCNIQGWIVSEIDISNTIRNYEVIQEDIILE